MDSSTGMWEFEDNFHLTKKNEEVKFLSLLEKYIYMKYTY